MEPDTKIVEEVLEPVDTPEEKETSQTPQYTEEETIAMARGWKPKEEWDGAEDEWKPAKVFNQIGELKEKALNYEKELKKANKVVTLMKEHHLNVRAAAYEQAVKDLKAQRIAALENENFAKAEKLRDEIDDIKDRFVNDDVLPQKVEQAIQETVRAEPDPALQEFIDRNPWYKPGGKDEMSKKADALGWAYRNEDPTMPFKEIIKNVEKDIKVFFADKFKTPANPVNEGGSRGSGARGGAPSVKLSDEERAIAKGFGMTEAEYAKELASYKGR